jgi:allantoinase
MISDVCQHLMRRTRLEYRPSNSQFIVRSWSSFNSTPDPSKSSSIAIFWSPRVVFGGDKIPYTIERGTVQVNKDSGLIDACFPGESKERAIARTKQSSSNSIDFIDLSISATGSTRHGERDKLSSPCLSPGLIDIHTHISSLGRNWEGYTSATEAAAAGGITTIIGMPLNSLPPTCSVKEVEMELEEANSRSKLYVDVGLWGGILPETAPLTDQLSELLSHPNILGLKAFLSPLPPNAGYQALDPNQLLDVARLCGTFQKPILVHSELMTTEELHKSLQTCFPKDGSLDNSHLAHVRSRPAEWEQAAVEVVVEATKYCDMHVVHLSDALGCLPIIENAKRAIQESGGTRSRLTVESCPHYLLLDSSQVQDGDTRVKCFPPIREKEQREALWKGLRKGLIDMVASDHSPCEPHMRQTSLRSAWGGLTGLQYQLPATWTAAQKMNCGITEADIAKWWSQNPAYLAGLTEKGSIEPEKRADFVCWDTEFLAAPDSYSNEYHRWKGDCYYSSQQLFGRVLGTWLGGEKIYDGAYDKLLIHKGCYIQK